LYWYDLETFGIDPREYRIAQFAGLRTDLDLNIVDDPLVMYCRASDDCLPDPNSCLITGITPQKANGLGMIESEFIERINEQFARPNSCVVGYNNIRFDDEFVRYTLYRNFLDPYAREWQNGNSRWDIIDMVRLTWALRPDGINWPTHDDGSPSFKLEDLTRVNHIKHEAAHDAMSDVYATIAMARLIRDKQPRLFDFVFANRSKQALGKLLNTVQAKPVVHVSAMYSSSRKCTALVLPLVPHPVNKNAVVVYDLSEDPEPLFQLSAAEIKQRLYTPASELEAAGLARIPLKLVHINKSPIVVPLSVLDEAASRRVGLDKQKCAQNRERLLAGQGLSSKMRHKLQQVYRENGFAPDADPDHGLYNGFFNDADRRKMQSIRRSTPKQLAELDCVFDDRRLPEMLFRYRARNFYESLNEDEKQQWQEHCYEKLTRASANAMTVLRYQEILRDLRRQHPGKAALLDELQAYGESLLPQLEPA